MSQAALAPHRLGSLPPLGRAAVGMGVFDGVHVGHRALLDGVTSVARELAAAPVALVFDPHPREVLRPGLSVPRLDDVAETVRRIESLGIHAVVVAFDRDVSALGPEEFLDALAPGIDLAALVMTPASAFGHARAGTLERAATIGRRRGFSVRIVALVELDGGAVSSSRARAAVQEGDLAAAERLLGRPHSIAGDVAVEEDGLARLIPRYAAALPPAGRYAARVDQGGAAATAVDDAVLEVSEPGGRLQLWHAPGALSGGRARVSVLRPATA